MEPMTLAKPRTLNQITKSARSNAKAFHQRRLALGVDLADARALMPDNRVFGNWLQDNDHFGFDRSWLRRLRIVAEERDRLLLGTESPIDINVEYRRAMALRNGSQPTLEDTTPKHPAKFTDTIIPVIDKALGNAEKVLDPFAGTGRIHQLENRDTVGIEIEPEWANQHPDTQIGNALDLPFADQTFDAVATSPTYGNRLADHHNAQDGSERRSYTHDLNRPLDPNNSGDLQWGDEYKTFHRKAWTEAVRVLKPGGKLVLNISDHIRDGKAQGVPAWHANILGQLGLELVTAEPVPTPRQRHGENAGARMDAEWVYTFQLL